MLFIADDLNIVFIVLNDARRLHDQHLQRQLYRPRARDRPADAGLLRFYHAMFQLMMFAHEPRAGRQQYRPDVGRDRAGDADHGHDGRHLPHPRGARSGVEIFHPRQRRHRARAVRHHPRLSGGAAGRRRGPATPWPGPMLRRPCGGSFDPALLNVAFVFLLLGYGTKVGPGAAACLAARRACGRPDADFGGAVRPAAECRALRAAALQDDARRQSGGASRPAR